MKKYLILLLTAAPSLALAHAGHNDNGFMSGLLHPISGTDHILAMVAVGLWAAGFSGRARWFIPAAFVLTMIAGFIYGANGGSVPLTEQGIAASVLVIGLAAAWIQRIPAVLAAVIVGAFALFHGVAHGSEMHGEAVWFAAGFTLSTCLLHAAGFLTGHLLHKNLWLNRIAGTVIGIIGLNMLLA